MIAISAQDISKSYLTKSSNIAKFKDALFSKNQEQNNNKFYALKNINFELKKGETLGILGVNGAGKSTLLKIIAGVVAPSSGILRTNGSLSALLELGAGFNLEFTGIENARMALAMAGVKSKDIDQMLDEVLCFADIGKFASLPVKLYSSGMFVRLAFACATVSKPDILLVDEALSVGDLFFQSKCIKRMKDLLNDGSTLVFVSHDISAVKSICQKCLLINSGSQELIGETSEVAQKYFSIKINTNNNLEQNNNKILDKNNINNNLDNNKLLDFEKKAMQNRSGNNNANFLLIELLDINQNNLESFEFGQEVILRMHFKINKDIDELCAGYHIQSCAGVDIIYSDTIVEKQKLVSLKSGEHKKIDWRFKLNLGEGSHNIACVLSCPIDMQSGEVEFCDYIHCAVQFGMQRRPEAKIYSLSYWENKITIY